MRKVGIHDEVKIRHFGTISEVDEHGQVVVTWDIHGKEKKTQFKRDDNDQYELLLYDNAQTGKPLCHLIIRYHNMIIFKALIKTKMTNLHCPRQ